MRTCSVCLTVSVHVSYAWVCGPSSASNWSLFSVENRLTRTRKWRRTRIPPYFRSAATHLRERIGSLSENLSSARVEKRPDAVRQVSKVRVLRRLYLSNRCDGFIEGTKTALFTYESPSWSERWWLTANKALKATTATRAITFTSSHRLVLFKPCGSRINKTDIKCGGEIPAHRSRCCIMCADLKRSNSWCGPIRVWSKQSRTCTVSTVSLQSSVCLPHPFTRRRRT